MPDGQVIECYAKTVAERVARKAYPQGFAHHYFRPKLLKEPLRVKTPSGIFLDSMGDLMGDWVSDEQIEQVFDTCRRAQQHIFMLLTKNPGRLYSPIDFPENVWQGVSSPPDWMRGQRLTRQDRMLKHSLGILWELDGVRWISFEPLSWDVAEIVEAFPGALDWAVIGAASHGPRQYPPDEGHLRALVDVLDDQGVPIFFKGNLKSLIWARKNWRQEFPEVGGWV
jgi:protein gp37